MYKKVQVLSILRKEDKGDRMMERLTYRTTKGEAIRNSSVADIGDILEKLAEYEDLEEQGLLLRFPCKIGSTLYQPIHSSINEYKVIGLCFDIHHNKWMYEVAYETGFEWHKTVCDFNYIGKTVFLTKAEAEQKLKEMESE